jgi:periplasmic divalent cation tolerance protein
VESSIQLCLVLTTWPADRASDELAARLVEEGLAACVSVAAPMTSHYRWDGALERAEERQVVIKTTRDALPALEARLAELHPYEVPEWLVLAAEASEAYGRWVRAATRLAASG